VKMGHLVEFDEYISCWYWNWIMRPIV